MKVHTHKNLETTAYRENKYFRGLQDIFALRVLRVLYQWMYGSVHGA
jgi:hypothetical protein